MQPADFMFDTPTIREKEVRGAWVGNTRIPLAIILSRFLMKHDLLKIMAQSVDRAYEL